MRAVHSNLMDVISVQIIEWLYRCADLLSAQGTVANLHALAAGVADRDILDEHARDVVGSQRNRLGVHDVHVSQLNVVRVVDRDDSRIDADVDVI